MTAGPSSRHLGSGRLVLATHNPGKVREIAELLAPHRIEPVVAATLSLPEPEETGTTFAANAELKALASALGSGLPALADDSGLCIPALGGDPGIYSARWAGPEQNFAAAMDKIEAALVAKGPATDRAAYFVCALSLAWPDGESLTFEGRVDGTLVWPPRGDKGFGYDPMFLLLGSSLTFGEMDPAAKHAISHRAHAFEQLAAAVFT